jgi:cytochrome c-type biogenesis protein CcmH
MTTFIVVAALMAALAAAAVAVPLWRHRQTRVLGAIAGLLVAGAAAGLYPLWSNWEWRTPEVTASPEVLAMVSKLEAHLTEDPKDLKGWLMLGRSYGALERLDDAVVAYEHARRLDPANAEAALGLAEAMSLRAGGSISPEASQLFEQALSLDPDNPKALLYGGFAAAQRGDLAAARQRWMALKAMHPPAQIEQLLDSRIAELGPAGAAEVPPAMAGAAAPGAAAMGGAAGPAGANPPGTGPAAGPQVTLNLQIAPALKSRLKADALLFVFAREPGGSGPPLAAKRLTSSAIGTRIQLSAADSLMPGRSLVDGHQVSITARVSFSGQPLPAAGDLYGELTYDVGHDGARDLVIDRIAE